MLRLILEPVQATYIVRDDTLYIVSRAFVDEGRVLQQPIHAVFSHPPLSTAVDTLANRTGATIVLEPTADASADTPITAKLSAMPVETAVRVLARMAHLHVVRIGTALYIGATSSNAARQAESKRRTK